MNVTFDDTSPYFSFSSDWRVQPANDASTNSFWQGTYHAAQSKGAQMSLTFNGAGIYLYGTKGPGNAKYSIEIDDKAFYLDAKASKTAYQQLLYSSTFKYGSHTLTLRHEGTGAAVGGDGGWLDVDFIMVTIPLPDGVQTQSNPGSFATTAGGSNGSGFAPTSGAPDPSNTGTTSQSNNSDSEQVKTSKSSDTSKIAAIALGAALGVVLLAFAAWFLYRGLTKKRKDEEAFRRGSSQGSHHVPPPPTMHSRSKGVVSYSGTAPMSPEVVADPFASPPASHFTHAPARSATSSPGPSVLQIGRSVALLENGAEPGMVAFPRAHSSLSHNTTFTASSYADTPYSAQPHFRSESFDALREAAGISSNAGSNRQSVLSNGSTVPLGIATGPTAASGPSAWLNQPPEVKSKGKEWKSQGAGQRATRTWNAGGGAPSIKTFVEVMDE
ncbi:hypothetical protein BKA62DRAFT_41742 [Auriculariales sp. MPI-PUGE-AT-0066]|nr:hypothetical protein BKA62DRAFT_41742 [Auriculariales sp. MPI-PUGE-AT-0066]